MNRQMDTFDREIRFLKGIGEKRAGLYEKLGVFSVRDLLRDFPRDYEDRRTIAPLGMVTPGMSVCVRASVITAPTQARIPGGTAMVRLRIADESGEADVTFFNQVWVKNNLHVGEEYIFYGLFQQWKNAQGRAAKRLSLVNPVYERVREDGPGANTGRIMPVYRLTAGLGQQHLRASVTAALDLCGGEFEEILPQYLRDRYVLQNAAFCYQNIHFPESGDALGEARRRFVFEELFLLALGLRRMKGEREVQGIPIDPPPLERFTQVLPFTLTGAQRRAIEEIARDLASGRPMNRLVQGDVGSGKTMVAAAAAWMACSCGCQTALMAPTELLAAQHYETLSGLFEKLGLRTLLLTGSLTAAKKRQLRAVIASGEADVVIGTHALLTADVTFAKLGLVITDEQHRFGVLQRSALAGKGMGEEVPPHTLVMSATPIPRTLALMLYGDLDVSRIDELPPGRKPVRTFAVDESYRPRIESFIRRLVGEGRQVFIVCPLVESPDGTDDGRKAVEDYAKNLRETVFPDLTVELLHGRMKQKQKDEIMARVAAGAVDILVATTVIEVGIDVPNAALMVVENSERFGLSQLHQLRGRVGRGSHESYCILMENGGGEATKERLKAMVETNDGFRIAEADLKLRGPGDFFGSRQHGIPTLKIADVAADNQVMMHASEAAGLVAEADPALERPEHALLRREIERMFSAGGGLN